MSDDANSNKFAKLFERDGEQVLVMKDTADNGGPCVSFTCDLGGVMATPKITFKDTDKGFSERDRMFNECTEEAAFGMREKMVAQFGHIGQDDDGAEAPTVAAARKKRKP